MLASSDCLWRQCRFHGHRDVETPGQQRPRCVREIWFEELVTAPEQTLRAVFEFLDEPFDPAVLTRSPIHRGPERSARPEVRNLSPAADATRDRAWRTCHRCCSLAIAGEVPANLRLAESLLLIQ
jgi:hypothetical protein